ncbi:MAG TPA: amidase [Solirubrobacterales bacterium]|nr:amidase [Solirubrobacterales bacterium]
MEATIERIEARNPSLNALVYTDFVGARERAKAAEKATEEPGDLGPLHGVPSCLKDLYGFKPGWPNTFGGIRALKDFQVDAYCAFAERVEKAGAILVGKGNSPVMGYSASTDNPLFGPTSNPFDTSRNPGGSSGGSAAAVADGLFPFAQGTDGGGSVRIPASLCGIFGIKPSFGRVPFFARPSAFVHTSPFIFEGALTRTVDDAALVLDSLAGHDPRDPYSVDGPIKFQDATKRSVKGMRIAYCPEYDVFPVDPRVSAVVKEAVLALEEAGAIVEEVEIGLAHDQHELCELWHRLVLPAVVGGFDEFREAGIDLYGALSDDIPPELLELAERGKRQTVSEMALDQGMRTEVLDAFSAVFENHDLVVGPTLCSPPVPNSQDPKVLSTGPVEINGVTVDKLIGWCPTYIQNFTGAPAASVPAGLSEGLPIGLHIVGRRWGDVDVLAASAELERIRPWNYDIPSSRQI